MISIDTKRLHLRNVSQNDVQAMFDYRNNEICAKYQRGQAKDYEEKKSSLENSMKVVVSQVNTEALKYSYSELNANKATVESNLLSYLRDLFQTDSITSVTLTKMVVS